jgi:uncharacterized protein YyaL (SSP411 family)
VKKTRNRLAAESSPYLLLHAANPVEWRPWGPDALAIAKESDKPIFLSIGYSACHWCHVMERESFSDPEIAAFLNKHFVCIKVDREERPDVDEVYMTALTLYFERIGSKQGGGWPLSMFLTPDAKPFAGGTYLPPRDIDGRTGFMTLCRMVQAAWEQKRDDVIKNAEWLSKAVSAASRIRPAIKPPVLAWSAVQPVIARLAETFDEQSGGFVPNGRTAKTPKFPVPIKLLLLEYAARVHKDDDAGRMLQFTLDQMASGGIFDQLEGGFHRYCVDPDWRVPHFEKMLYDNAQLIEVYSLAYERTREPRHREIVEQTFAFLEEELTEGGFGGDSKGVGLYAALDADTDGVEGGSYLWSREQLRTVLDGGELRLAERFFGLTGEPPLPEGYVLRQPISFPDLAKSMELTESQLSSRLKPIVNKLRKARKERPAPAVDIKIITAWNGLAIRGLAVAGRVLQRDEMIQAAEQIATFVVKSLADREGRLYRTSTSGKAKRPAFVEDYAFTVSGLLELHRSTGNDRWVREAKRLTDLQIELFWDDARGGFFFTANDHEPLLARIKPAHDSVMPSPNGVSVRNLVRLCELTQEPRYAVLARKTLQVFVPEMEAAPSGMTGMALALGEFLANDSVVKLAETELTPAELKGARRQGKAAPGAVAMAGGVDDGPVAEKTPRAKSDTKINKNDADPFGEESPREESPHVVARGDKMAEKSAGKKAVKPGPVKATVYLRHPELPAGKTCRVLILLEIEKGWHINANIPGSDDLIPTAVECLNDDGVKLLGIEYPVGTELEDETGKHRIYSGRVALPGVISIPRSLASKQTTLEFVTIYQACLEGPNGRCLPRKTVKVTVETAVKSFGDTPPPTQHDNLFAPRFRPGSSERKRRD